MPSLRLPFLVLSAAGLLLSLAADGCAANERDPVILTTDAGRTDGQGETGSGQDEAGAAFTVHGRVEGLAGTGMTLALGDETVHVEPNDGGDVEFGFTTKLPTGASYAVSVATQPKTPAQACTVTDGEGFVQYGDVFDVLVRCETGVFTVGGSVIGLRGSGLVLQNNAADNVAIAAPMAVDGGAIPNTPFKFTKKISSGDPFDVTVYSQPAGPSQTCIVSGGKGTVVAGDVNTVTVNCDVNSYTVGGSVNGMLGTGLKLKLNGGSEITPNIQGGFSFPDSVVSGEPYDVTISGQPTDPWQTCVIEPGTGTGTVGAENVESIVINCARDAFTIGGTVEGLVGAGLTLANGGDFILVTADGGAPVPFTFPTSVLSGDTYAAIVSHQPTDPWQTCNPVSPTDTGSVGGADVTSVAFACATNSYKVGVGVSGLNGAGLELTNNGVDEISIATNGPHSFPISIASGASYAVAISSQPVGSRCTVSGGGPTVMQGADVSIPVTCNAGVTIGQPIALGSVQTAPADYLIVRPVTATGSGTAISIGGFWADSTCNVKYAIYSDSAGAPGNLLGQTGVVLTTSTGASEALLTSDVAITAGTYWIAFVSVIACHGYYAPAGGPGFIAKPQTFAAPLPSSYGAGFPTAGADVSMYLRVVP